MFENKDENNRTGFEVAVIGMAGRFPKSKDIDGFWDNLKKGVDCVSFFSNRELEEEGLDAELIRDPNYIKAKGVLEDAGYFDSDFFDYTPKAAELMDPQLRVFHECAWEALENAAYDPNGYDGLIGLYAGASPNFPWIARSLFLGADSSSTILETASLIDKDYLSTRISYKLNLRGPSISLRTTCSTSLVAVHLASQGLLSGECDIALAGGVTIVLPQKSGYRYQEGMVQSPDGHCRAFDARSQGSGGGNGVGVVVLKRLDEALAEGDHICAVIKGTAVNNDGIRKVGYTAPGVEGQAAVIRAAFQMAEVEPRSIGYVETHGTGTTLGDPIEIEALSRAFNTEKKGFCAIGAVKSNMGHLDSAAGVAGFIKTVLALQHRMIPPTLYFERPNPKIDFINSPFYVNAALTQWENGGGPLRAGVSSFGIGGTNAHVILEEAPKRGNSSKGRPWKLILLSARTQSALNKMTENLVGYFKKNPKVNPADAAYTLQVGRQAFKYRKAVVCTNVDEAVSALSSLTGEKIPAGPSSLEPGNTAFFKVKDDKRPVVFVFPGEQSLYTDMGLELYRQESIFREEMDQCFAILKPLLDIDIKETLYPGDFNRSYINQPEIIQPVIFIIEYALAKLLMKWGIRPYAMMGDGVGEYAAACLSGVFSLKDALGLVVLRGKLMQKKAAGHSILDPVVSEFGEALGQAPRNEPKIPYVSAMTGKWASTEEVTGADYWLGHLEAVPGVREGLADLFAAGSIFVNLGSAGRDLDSQFLKTRGSDRDHQLINLVRPHDQDQSDLYYLLRGIGRLWLLGKKIDWSAYYAGEERYRIPLPTYPFERRQFNIDIPTLERVLRGDLSILDDAFLKEKPDPDDWFYVPSWEPSAPPVLLSEGFPGPQKWLFFVDDCGLGLPLIDEPGANIIRVNPGNRFTGDRGGGYTINPRESKDYDALFRELAAKQWIPDRIVHLWGVGDKDDKEESRLEWADRCLALGFYSLLYVVRAIKNQGINKEIKIDIVTNGAQGTAGETLMYPEKAAVLGLVKTIPKEYENIKCTGTDVKLCHHGGRQAEQLVNRLKAELLSDSSYPIAALRHNHRLVPAVLPIKMTKPPGTSSLPGKGGNYLVIGEPGDVAFALTGYVINRLKGRGILVLPPGFPGRSKWQEHLDTGGKDEKIGRNIRKIRELEESGADIATFWANIMEQQQMQDMMGRVNEQYGPIDGVFYCAAKVLDPAVKAVLLLDTILEDKPPVFFVSCSSLDWILPKPGEVGQCPVNSFLDAYANYKVSKFGQFFCSINWDVYREGGKRELSDQEINDILDRVLARPLPVVAVSKKNLKVLVERSTPAEPSFVPGESTRSFFSSEYYQRPELGSEYVPARNEFEQKLIDIWEELFKIKPIGVYDNFFELGGDSLKGITFVNRFRELLDEIVHVTIMFDAPTVAELAAYFNEHYSQAVARLMGLEFKQETVPADGIITREAIEQARQMLSPLPSLERVDPGKNPPAMFILCAPRTGSTLLRVILGGHPGLFAPPELNLLSYNDLADRRASHPEYANTFLQGTIRAIMQARGCDVEEAARIMEGYEKKKMSCKQFYGLIQEWIGERLLVDKSTIYTQKLGVLKRAETDFRNPVYLHLVRHPYGMINSYEEARMDLFLGREVRENIPFSRRQLAELIWTITNQNVLEFLKDVPGSRWHRVKFEELVREPQPVVQGICQFLGLDFHPGMLEPYKERKQRMTDGVYSGGMMVGDMKFHEHKKIKQEVADRWRQRYPVDFLGNVTWEVAESFGYKRPPQQTEQEVVPTIEKINRAKRRDARQLLGNLDQLSEKEVNLLVKELLVEKGGVIHE